MRYHQTLFLAIVAMLLGVGSAFSQSVEDFYKGKTVRIVVGNSAGGGSDLNARMLARFMGKYIPGNPRIVVENMPGASSLKSVQYLDSGAPTDGTVITAFNPGPSDGVADEAGSSTSQAHQLFLDRQPEPGDPCLLRAEGAWHHHL